MYNCIKKCMDDNHVFYEHQYGFRQTHSSQQAIIKMYTLVMSNSVLTIEMLMVSASRWGLFFGVVDSGLQVKLTEL